MIAAGTPAARRIALSFDNGPDPDVTPAVLDVLRDRAVPAQFYVLGKHLAGAGGRRLIERARDAGHAIGNHSFSHAVPLGQDARPDAAEAEIGATDALLTPLVPGPRRFRPYGGGGTLGKHLLSRRAVDYLVAHGHSCILWNSVPRDWIDPEGWPARALADCATRPHTLLVLHDVPNACLAGLAGFIDAARAAGFDLVGDVPPACAPIVDGRIVGAIDELVAD
jgi:peptidoglycan/xylan/chitin deacetylase (PgdA/CDA1 family)